MASISRNVSAAILLASLASTPALAGQGVALSTPRIGKTPLISAPLVRTALAHPAAQVIGQQARALVRKTQRRLGAARKGMNDLAWQAFLATQTRRSQAGEGCITTALGLGGGTLSLAFAADFLKVGEHGMAVLFGIPGAVCLYYGLKGESKGKSTGEK